MARAIWIARHASRLDFADPEWHRTAERPHDSPLSLAGRAEAWALGERLRHEPIAHLFASPFLRAVETAAAVAEALDVSVKVERGLSEWLNRAWFPAPPETLPLSELVAGCRRVDPGYASRGQARYGESAGEALGRSGETARRLAGEFPGDLLLVGHGASVLGATAGLLGHPALEDLGAEVPYCSIVKLVQDGDAWRLELTCDTSHLTAAQRTRCPDRR
jgi:broad specificity phosphatase PhoE